MDTFFYQRLKAMTAWDRRVEGKELLEAVKRGESPFFDRFVARETWAGILEVFGTPEAFFAVLRRRFPRPELIRDRLLRARVEDLYLMEEYLMEEIIGEFVGEKKTKPKAKFWRKIGLLGLLVVLSRKIRRN